MPPSREELILSLAPQVNAISRRMYRDFPAFFDLDDVMIEAWIGAIQAVDRFDPARGAKLETVAQLFIQGRILDFFQRTDFAGKWARKRIKAGKEEGPRMVELSTVFYMQDPLAHEFTSRIDARLDVGRIMGRVGRVRITPRQYSILTKSFSDVRLNVIAKEQKVSPSRISSLRTDALVKLRASIVG